MNKHKIRKEAIRRFLNGEKPSTIAKSLSKSRKWIYKWIHRFNEFGGVEGWYSDKSRAPHNPRYSIDEDLRHQILLIRRELVALKMAQIGAIAIQYEFKRRGVQPIPQTWTINRVISNAGLTKKTKFKKYIKEYPELFFHTHQIDFVGPRYIKGDGLFYSVNIMDVPTHSCSVNAIRSKVSSNVVQALASFWSSFGLPDALQMDNELSFRGSNQHPRGYGKVVRFALSQGVSPVFIPYGEPWRNAYIEGFNNTYNKKLIRPYVFKDFNDLKYHEKVFEEFHNSNHRYSSQGNKTPKEMQAEQLNPAFYTGQIHHLKKIPLTTGKIYFIRLIRSDLKLKIVTENFNVPNELKYSYVAAEINIDKQQLYLIQNNRIVASYPYSVNVDW